MCQTAASIMSPCYADVVVTTHLEQCVEEYLSEWLGYSEMAVTGADLEGSLQALDRN